MKQTMEQKNHQNELRKQQLENMHVYIKSVPNRNHADIHLT